MSAIIQRATKAINGQEGSDELNSIKLGLSERRFALSQRHAAITEGGPARRQAVESGDVAQVQQLDTEAREIAAEMEVTGGMESKIQASLIEARANEAVTKIPATYKQLAKAIEAERSAVAMLEKARATSDQYLRTLRQHRTHLQQSQNTGGARHSAPAAKPDLLNRFLGVRGIAPTPREGWGRAGHLVEEVADCLGLETPSKAA